MLADPIGIGSEDTFGWGQIVGVVVGAGIAAIGIVMAWRAENPRPDVPTEE